MATEAAAARPRRLRRDSDLKLSRLAIARAALRIIDRDGVDAASMRRVAAELDVAPMSLYGHIRDRQDLLDAVVDEAVSDTAPPALTGDWQRDLIELFGYAHSRLAAHPAIVRIRFIQPVLRPEALRLGEAAIGILSTAGLPDEEAAACFRLLFTYTFGFAGLSPHADATKARTSAAVAIAGLDPASYPNLTRAAGEVAVAMAGDEVFAYGLERIVDGIAARVASEQPD